jgi:hypothetical protein
LICPNCGRRNSAGATFCSRCHQRLPLATKLSSNHRRTVVVEPRGGGGSGAIVLAVALLAGFIFIGGAAAIYLSNPPGPADPTDIGLASGSPTLPPFVQPTATPSPSPTFILLPSESPSFSALPTFTTVPTITPGGPTNPPTAAAVVVKFTCAQLGDQRKVTCSDNSTGPIESRQWDFGDGSPPVSDRNPTHEYPPSGPNEYTVTLVVTGTDGLQYFKQKKVSFQAPATPTPAPTATPAETPSPTPPTPTPALTIVIPQATATPIAPGSSAP